MLHKWWFLSQRVFPFITHYKPGGKWDLQTLWRVPGINIVLVNMTAVVRNQPWERAAEQLMAGMWSLQSVACTTGCKMKLSPSLEPVELSCRQPFGSCWAAENFLEPVVMKAWSFISGGPETSLPPYSPQSHLVDNTWVWVNVGHLLKFLEYQGGWGGRVLPEKCTWASKLHKMLLFRCYLVLFYWQTYVSFMLFFLLFFFFYSWRVWDLFMHEQKRQAARHRKGRLHQCWYLSTCHSLHTALCF